MVRALYISSEHSPTKRFTAGAHGAICAIIVITMLCVQSVFVHGPREQRHVEHQIVQFSLYLAQILLAATVFASSVSLPRRPAVFVDSSKSVDNQRTVSLFSRATFGWNASFLEISSRKIVELGDLPRPAAQNRASILQQSFDYKRYPGSLWKTIVFAHSTSFLGQFVLTILEAFTDFAPQLSLFKILGLLELRTSGQEIGYEIWYWLLFQGLSFLLKALVEAWVIWISQTRLSQPIRVEMNASIFQKAMRKKDVKEVKKAASAVSEDTADDASTSSNSALGEGDADEASIQEENKPQAKLRQSTVNLISTDARRLAEFGSIVRAIPDAAMNMVISLTFLLVIIGWKPLLLGLVAFSIGLPINAWLSRKLTAIQDKLMEVRDEKTETISEAFGSLRQIKFSALENQWQAKITEVRDRELSLLWYIPSLPPKNSNKLADAKSI